LANPKFFLPYVLPHGRLNLPPRYGQHVPSLVLPTHSHDADDLTAARPDRQLRDNVPLREALRVEPQLDSIEDRLARGVDALIVADVALGHAAGVKVEVGQADHIRLVGKSVALAPAAVDEHDLAPAVLGEEVESGEGLEQDVEQAFWGDLPQPGLPLGQPALDLGGATRGLAARAHGGGGRCRIWHKKCRLRPRRTLDRPVDLSTDHFIRYCRERCF